MEWIFSFSRPPKKIKLSFFSILSVDEQHSPPCSCSRRDYRDENKTSLVPALLHRSNLFITPPWKGVSLSDAHVDDARILEMADNPEIEDNPGRITQGHRGTDLTFYGDLIVSKMCCNYLWHLSLTCMSENKSE